MAVTTAAPIGAFNWTPNACSTFAIQRTIRVGVLPLGGVSDEQFKVYLKMLRRFVELPMANLSKPGTWKKEKSPFKYFSWYDGSLALQFVDCTAGPQQSEWQDFQAHRRIWAVIGVLHVPSCAPGSMVSIEAEFKAKVAAFPFVVTQKVFVFGYNFTDGAHDLSVLSIGSDLVVYPPEGDTDTGMSMVELHMGVVLNDLAVALLGHLEGEVSRTRASSRKSTKKGGPWSLGLRSPFDDDGPDGKDKDGRKGNQGRMLKWVGDLCLLSGTPQDAVEAHLAAIAECKAAADSLWQAGSVEGFIASLLTMQSWGLPVDDHLGRDLSRELLTTEKGPKVLLSVIEDRSAEALTLYESQPAFAPLAVDLCFKMAQYHGFAKPPRYNEAVGMTVRGMNVQGLELQRQILRSLEAAALTRAMGMTRKFAFMLRLASMQAADLQNYTAAHALCRIAATAYGVSFLDETAEPPPPTPPRKDFRSVYPPPPGGWPCLQKNLLLDLIAFATSSRDVTSACGYYLSLLHMLGELEQSRQRAMMLSQGSAGAIDAAAAHPPPPPSATGSARPKLLLDSESMSPDAAPLSRSTNHARFVAKESDVETVDDGASEQGSLAEENRRSIGTSSASGKASVGFGAVASTLQQRKVTSSGSGGGATTPHVPSSRTFTFGRSRGASSVLRPFRGALRMDDKDHADDGGSGGGYEGSVISYNVAAAPEDQEAIIAEMMKLTRRLPPRTILDIRGLPLVHLVRPMRLSGDLVPLERAVTGAASAFIYNPFSKGGDVGSGSVTWTAGEVAQVALILSNPLGAPLHIQRIELLIDAEDDEAAVDGASGPAAFCYPLTLWVPACRRYHPLTLSIKPLRPGGLVIRGVRLTVFNVTSECLVDAQGNGPAMDARCAPRDCYPRRVPYTRVPKGEKQSVLGARLPIPEGAMSTNRVAVVQKLPWLSTKLDRWVTNIELYPGEYRRTTLELQVNNEVEIGYLEVSLQQKVLTKKQRPAGRPQLLYLFSSTSPANPTTGTAPDQLLYEHDEQCVSLEAQGIEALDTALREGSQRGVCLSSIFMPLLLKRVDKYPEADILVRYSWSPDHRHFRTLTIPLRFHLKDGLSLTDLNVETAGIGVYPTLITTLETAHRMAQDGLTRRKAVDVDTDHDRCFLVAEVANGSEEDMHIKTCCCVVEGTQPLPPPPKLLEREVELLEQYAESTTTPIVIKPKASRRIVIPFPRISTSSALLQPPPPPPPPLGGGKAPPPLVTLDSPEWTRALHGLSRWLRLHWCDEHGLRAGLLRVTPVITPSLRPGALARLKRAPVRLSTQAGLTPSAFADPASTPAPPEHQQQQVARPHETPPRPTRSPPLFQVLEPVVVRASMSPIRTTANCSSASGCSNRRLCVPPYTFIAVQFRLENTSEHALAPSLCFCHAYQDYGSGNLMPLFIEGGDGPALWSGSLQWVIPPLEPEEDFVHTAFVSFTAPGTYGVGFSSTKVVEAHSEMQQATRGRRRSRSISFSGVGADQGHVIYWGHQTLEIVVTKEDAEVPSESSSQVDGGT